MKRQLSDLLKVKGSSVYTVEADTTVYHAIEEMDRKNVGALVVVEGKRVVGIVSERDYTRKVILRSRSSKECTVRDIMSADLIVAKPETTIEEAMQLMTSVRVRHLPVMVGGELRGILSIGDLVKSVIKEQREQIDWLHEYAFGPQR